MSVSLKVKNKANLKVKGYDQSNQEALFGICRSCDSSFWNGARVSLGSSVGATEGIERGRVLCRFIKLRHIEEHQRTIVVLFGCQNPLTIQRIIQTLILTEEAPLTRISKVAETMDKLISISASTKEQVISNFVDLLSKTELGKTSKGGGVYTGKLRRIDTVDGNPGAAIKQCYPYSGWGGKTMGVNGPIGNSRGHGTFGD